MSTQEHFGWTTLVQINDTHLDLINVDVLEFFLHFFGANLHGVHRRLRVLQRLRGVVRLLHVEHLSKAENVTKFEITKFELN